MNLFGLTVARTKALSSLVTDGSGALTPAASSGWGGFMGFVREGFAGAWQKNVVVDSHERVTAFSAVYACVTLISNDIGKLRPKLMQEAANLPIWQEVETNSPFLPVLSKPNHYQNRMQFITHWIMCKLLHGNAYALKQRDQRGVVVALYLLDPRLVIPLVAEDGSVFYQLSIDKLSELFESRIVPASEIIHDRMPCLFHPLLGTSPIYACGASATQGMRIQANSATFFENMSRPSGVLTAPNHIPDDLAARVKEAWENNFQGSKIGRLAVLGDGMKYEAMTIPAADAQLIEQLAWTVEDVARCFHVPLHMIGAGPNPTFQNIGAFNQAYYTQTLQKLIEDLELCLGEGLSLPTRYEVELDLDALFRMDTLSRYEAYASALKAGWMKPNEPRIKENYEPVEGGDTVYLQQQNFSLAALAKRDAREDPFATTPKPAPAAPAQVVNNAPAGPALPAPAKDVDAQAMLFAAKLISKFTEATYGEL